MKGYKMSSIKFTEEKKEWLIKNCNNKTVKECSEYLNICTDTLYRFLKKNNIKYKSKYMWVKEKINWLIENFQNKTIEECVEYLKIDKQKIRHKIKSIKCKNNTENPIGTIVKHDNSYQIKNRKFKKGDKRHDLTFIEYTDEQIYTHSGKVTIVSCECKCGNFIKIPSSRFGLKKSCGCRKPKRGKESWTFEGYEEIYLSYWNSLKLNAERRKIEFNITMEQVWQLYLKQNKKCALSGLDINFELKKRKQSASIDRINSNEGYTIKNIQIVHKDVNMMKWTHSQKHFIELCCLVSDFNKKEKSNVF